MSLPETVGWIFVAIFGVLAIITILNVINVVKIPDDEQRKWLFRSLIGSVVVAVAGFGSDYLKHFSTDPSPTATPALQPTTTPSTTATPTAAQTYTSTPTPAPAPTTTPTPAAADVPEALQEWAGSALGPRPTLSEIDAHPYPTCVQDLRSAKDGETEDGEVGACLSALNRYQTNILVGYYTIKRPYVANLITLERRFQSKADTDSQSRYAYILAEKARLNGSEWRTIRALEDRLLKDMDACDHNGCR